MGSDTLTEWDDGAFSEDLHYAYSIPLGHSSSSTEFHVMKGADAVSIFECTTPEAVFDIRVLNGEICMVKRLENNLFEFTHGSESKTFSPAGDDFRSGIWIVPSPGGACVKWCSRSGGRYAYWMFTSQRLVDCSYAAYGVSIPDMLLGGHYVTVIDGKESWYGVNP